MGSITLEIVTPSGLAVTEHDLDEVVFRRREEVPLGSEVAVLPHHGHLLARNAECDVRYRRGERIDHVHVGAGVTEVRDEHVLMIAPDARRVPRP